ERHAILLTADKDFGELVFRLNRAGEGIVLIRLHGFPSEEKAAITAKAIRDHGTQMQGCFSVITPGAIRIRPKW
ncbi:MAG: DUF5615 family PIN-like protein, partial [Pseudomonadota bacterium]